MKFYSKENQTGLLPALCLVEGLLIARGEEHVDEAHDHEEKVEDAPAYEFSPEATLGMI